MKKLIYAFGALFALTMISCVGETQQDEQVQETDSTLVETAGIEPVEVTGVAIDGAMNSVYLKVGEDTIEFSYPDLESDHRSSWTINDTLTVRYYVTENGDSVTDVINDSEA